MLNFSTRRVGGIRFFALGRLRLSFCVARRPSVARTIGLRAVALALNV